MLVKKANGILALEFVKVMQTMDAKSGCFDRAGIENYIFEYSGFKRYFWCSNFGLIYG